jgi:hypothetical protein
MSPRKRNLIDFNFAVAELHVVYGLPLEAAEMVLRGLLLDGDCYVRGKDRNGAVRNVSKEIGPTLWPDLLRSREFNDERIDRDDLLNHARDLIDDAEAKADPDMPTLNSNDELRAVEACASACIPLPKLVITNGIKSRAAAWALQDLYGTTGYPRGASDKRLAINVNIRLKKQSTPEDYRGVEVDRLTIWRTLGKPKRQKTL